MTALWFSGLTAGNVVGGLAGGAVAEWAGYSALALYIAAATGGVAVLALLLLPNMGRGSPGPRPGLRQTLAGYALLLRQTSYRLLVAMQMLRTFFWGGFQIMGPVMIAGLSGSKFVVGAFVSATTGVGLASMLLVGAFSDRRGRRGAGPDLSRRDGPRLRSDRTHHRQSAWTFSRGNAGRSVRVGLVGSSDAAGQGICPSRRNGQGDGADQRPLECRGAGRRADWGKDGHRPAGGGFLHFRRPGACGAALRDRSVPAGRPGAKLR